MRPVKHDHLDNKRTVLDKQTGLDKRTRRQQSGNQRSELRCRLAGYLVGGDPTLAEWILATLGIVWGGWLLLPMDSFAAAPHLYRYVSQLPDWAWGGAFCSLGILQLRAWYGLWQKARFYCGLIGATLWLRFGWLTWMGDHRSVSLAFLGVLACAQLLSSIWLWGKAYPSTADRRQGYDKF